jgi:prepilin peptidase CpaA
MVIDVTRLLLFPALMAFAAASDLFSMTISNKVSLALAGCFVILALAIGMSPRDMGMHAAAALTVLVVAFVFFARGWIGGGDAKLAAAASLWFGFDQLLQYLVDAALLGGVLTLVMINFRLIPLPPAMQRWTWIARLHEKGAGVPYGIALAAAALLIYPDTIWMKSFGG